MSVHIFFHWFNILSAELAEQVLQSEMQVI